MATDRPDLLDRPSKERRHRDGGAAPATGGRIRAYWTRRNRSPSSADHLEIMTPP
jgi:hypothetical protein